MSHSILEALETISTKTPVMHSEIIPIEDAVGRVASQDYIATFDLPRFDNSAMDGYAVRVADAGKSVTSTEVIYAGDNPNITLTDGTAVKIMTGAPLPQGCEAIIPKEDISIEGNKVTLPEGIKHNHFIRMAGEDIKKGSIFLHRGTEINAYTIASLASQGITHLWVYKKPKVIIFGTGDELRPHYEKIEAHQLYNSNTPMFYSRSKQLGCDTHIAHTSADTLKALESSIKGALDADIIITTGGVSVGDKDFTKEAFSNLGMKLLIDTIDIKPGRPTLVGMIGKTMIVNLPGNPLASMVNYELFVRTVIRKMTGKPTYHKTIQTKIKSDYSLRGGKYTAILGTFDGLSFEPISPQMSGLVSPMQKADGLILITPEVTLLKKDQVVKMIPIKWEFYSERKEELFSC